jgi:hypothetical protein
MSAFAETKRAEIDGNLARFLEMLPGLLAAHKGRYVLMRRGAVVGYYDTALDAQIAGNQKFDDEIFSIQPVTDLAEELGCFAYAVDPRES